MSPQRRGQIERRCCDPEGTCRCTDRKHLIRVYLGRVKGKRKYSSKMVYGPHKKAQKALAKWLRELDTDDFVEPNDTVLGEYLQDWLDGRARKTGPEDRGIRKATRRGYQSRLDSILIPSLGHYRLGQLSPQLLRAFFNDLQEDADAGAALTRSVYSILKMALNQAVEERLLQRSPLPKITFHRSKKKTGGDPMTQEEVRRILEATEGQRYHPLWFFLLGTGVRPQEALALQWRDIEEDGTCHIRRTLGSNESIKQREVSDLTKTEAGTRTFKLPRGVQKVLREHRKDQLREQMRKPGSSWNSEGWIFVSSNGRPPIHGNVHRYWKNALKKAGVRDRRLYDARHTAATLLIESGVPVKQVSDLLGHSSTAITQDVYVHVTKRMHQETADALDAAVLGGGAG